MRSQKARNQEARSQEARSQEASTQETRNQETRNQAPARNAWQDKGITSHPRAALTQSLARSPAESGRRLWLSGSCAAIRPLSESLFPNGIILTPRRLWPLSCQTICLPELQPAETAIWPDTTWSGLVPCLQGALLQRAAAGEARAGWRHRKYGPMSPHAARPTRWPGSPDLKSWGEALQRRHRGEIWQARPVSEDLVAKIWRQKPGGKDSAPSGLKIWTNVRHQRHRSGRHLAGNFGEPGSS